MHHRRLRRRDLITMMSTTWCTAWVTLAATFIFESIAGSARAQAIEPQESEIQPGDVPRSPDPDAAVWSTYHQAESNLRHGKREVAIRDLEALESAHPDHPAAAAAKVLIDRTIGAQSLREEQPT